LTECRINPVIQHPIRRVKQSVTKLEERDMDFGLGILTFGTLIGVAAFAWWNARETEALRRSGYRSALGRGTGRVA
jgi:hypothetical protein